MSVVSCKHSVCAAADFTHLSVAAHLAGTPGVHTWHAHLACTPGVHTWRAHLACTPGMHTWRAPTAEQSPDCVICRHLQAPAGSPHLCS